MHAPRAPLLWASLPPVAEEERESTLGDLACLLLEKLWLIVLFGVVGFFVTFGYLARQTPVYRATGSLQVVPPLQTAPDRLVTAEPNLSTAEQLNTLVQALVRPSFLLLVANDPDLQNDLSLFPPKPDGSAYSD